MADAKVVAWARADDQRGHGVARLAPVPGGWACWGTEVLAGPDAASSCHFRVDLDARWHTRRVHVTAVAERATTVELVCDGEGHWIRDGLPAPELAGCTDVDVAATPLTNTFPIRRLGELATGAAATLAMAWIDVPSLAVTRVEQTYTRLAERGWRYHDDTYGDFELTVDEDGLVVDYAGLATRVWP